MKTSLANKVEADSPPTISVGLDAWSEHHHGYLGYNAHYITQDWRRIIFNLGCTPFDESHTGENIYNKLRSVLQEWKIYEKTGLCVRDNAANMKAAFNGQNLESIGCLNHSLQLVIKGNVYTLTSVETVIGKCRKLASFANQSTKFYTEFYKQQEDLLNITDRQSLLQDVETRLVINSLRITVVASNLYG